MFGALKRGFRSMATLILVSNVVGELQPKRTLAASRGFLAGSTAFLFSSIVNSTVLRIYKKKNYTSSAHNVDSRLLQATEDTMIINAIYCA